MSAGDVAAIVLLVMLAILVWPSSQRELRLEREDTGGTGVVHEQPHALGISQLIASMIARVRAGSTLVAACAEESPRPFAVPRLSLSRVIELVEFHRSDADRGNHTRDVASGLLAASSLSDELGCPVSPCLQAVLDSYGRVLKAEDMRAQAFAVPQATMRLLGALPIITVMLGYVVGAHPLKFLFGSSNGLLCFGLGLLCYALGLLWSGTLLREMSRR